MIYSPRHPKTILAIAKASQLCMTTNSLHKIDVKKLVDFINLKTFEIEAKFDVKSYLRETYKIDESSYSFANIVPQSCVKI